MPAAAPGTCFGKHGHCFLIASGHEAHLCCANVSVERACCLHGGASIYHPSLLCAYKQSHGTTWQLPCCGGALCPSSIRRFAATSAPTNQPLTVAVSLLFSSCERQPHPLLNGCSGDVWGSFFWLGQGFSGFAVLPAGRQFERLCVCGRCTLA